MPVSVFASPDRCGQRHGGYRAAILAKFRAATGGNAQESQRTSWTRRAPQPLNRIESTASRTRASSPCRAARAAQRRPNVRSRT